MKSEKLLKVISDSFGPKAESIDVESFHLYFENRPSILSKMRASTHQFLVGRRGTGKTTFLKYLDLSTFTSSFTSIDNLPSVGFYINLGKFAIPNINILSSELASSVFSRWLPLKCVLTILNAIESCLKRKIYFIKRYFIRI